MVFPTKRHAAALSLLATLPLNACTGNQASGDAQWRSLFNGNDLSGWTRTGGHHNIRVENGIIIGTAVPKQDSEFLLSEQRFGDFILEAEFRIDGVLNSGIIFRSEEDTPGSDSGVKGYQMEIDPGARGWSGGLYAEGLPWGWLYPPNINRACIGQYRKNDWNHYRIEAIGSEISTFVNGVPCARITDDRIVDGHIALQVHGVEASGARGFPGDSVSWRSLRVLTDNLAKSRTPAIYSTPHITYRPNHLTEWERSQGWRMIEAVRTGSLGDFATADRTGGEEKHYTKLHAGDLWSLSLTDQKQNFSVKWVFRVAEGTEASIAYLTNSCELARGEKVIAPRYRITGRSDDLDSFFYTDGGREVGSLRGAILATNLSEPYPIMRINPVGEWNTAEIRVEDKVAQHWLNNIKVVEYKLIDRPELLSPALNGQIGEASSGSSMICLRVDTGSLDLHSIKVRSH
ncbi:family 16 glycoside hydrolase [Altererythrobacter lutimaris]|uniref:DUF1080 domain-containing protein n=1 Tax=Altererythrobacter lutimaris TaxID=2743979 RepID=A0A850H588_9SPHN|nr:family 16 glycoside hydrolase [Altererythrobacter lutimaris]NVE94374.1 DUF1080 domain-containing protein [Altererythrobacter lutimaris]